MESLCFPGGWGVSAWPAAVEGVATGSLYYPGGWGFLPELPHSSGCGHAISLLPRWVKVSARPAALTPVPMKSVLPSWVRRFCPRVENYPGRYLNHICFQSTGFANEKQRDKGHHVSSQSRTVSKVADVKWKMNAITTGRGIWGEQQVGPLSLLHNINIMNASMSTLGIP